MTGNITQAKLDYPCPKAISMKVMLIFFYKTMGLDTMHVRLGGTTLTFLSCSSKSFDHRFMGQGLAKVIWDGELWVNCEHGLKKNEIRLKLQRVGLAAVQQHQILTSKDNSPN